MVGLAPGQTARLNALNAGPGGPAPPDSNPPGSCWGGVTFEFYGAAGELLKKSVIANLGPGQTAFLDLSRDQLTKSAGRTQIRAVLHFGYGGGAPLPPESRRFLECNIVPSLEIYDTTSGRTTLALTNATPLPAPSSPPR